MVNGNERYVAMKERDVMNGKKVRQKGGGKFRTCRARRRNFG